MARLSDEHIQRLKTEISLVRLAESQGYALKKAGKDYVLSCPFHEDKTPSLKITPEKNLYHCFGCGAAGSVIDWVMAIEGISFRHACEVLRTEYRGQGTETKKTLKAIKPTKTAALSRPLPSVEDLQTLLHKTLEYYHECLLQSPEALDYLESRGLNDAVLIRQFKLGFANRTLGYRIPTKATVAGRELRSKLHQMGLIRASGHEHFNGSIVMPIINHGVVTEVYGRKISGKRLRKGTPLHLYLPGPHVGIWNHECLLDGDQIILCEALIDAMTFWVHGFKNVTCSYGTGGFTDELFAAFLEHNIKRVLIAYDRDEAGNKAAKVLTEKLTHAGIDCFRIELPKNMDVNDYALQLKPAQKSLALVIRKAVWLGNGKSPELTSIPNTVKAKVIEKKAAKKETNNLPSLAANPEPSTTQALKTIDELVEAEVSEKEVVIELDNRRYRIRGLNKNTCYERLKVNVLASCGESLHIDSFDLYSARHRVAFIKQAAYELGLSEQVIKTDLGSVLLKLEQLHDKNIKGEAQSQSSSIVLSDEEREEALSFLTSPNLCQTLLKDFNTLGVVGEESNKLLGYLAACSRQLRKPLAILIQSSSAAGKSSLMEAILNLMPEEERVQYSAMTGQSLFYMGETNLKHKILAIAEEEGAAQASYALKLLQSDGQITIASTGKDAVTGHLETQSYTVEGPVMLFLTTTAIDIDEELLNRCLVLTVNESIEQTKAIHNIQRQAHTLEGRLMAHQKKQLIHVHRNAQRLLRPLTIVNPFAEQLTFLSDKTRMRRDHEKYLSLIDSITLLHQYQRETKRIEIQGEWLEYIEVSKADIELANQLAHEVLGRSLDELPPQTRKLLKLTQKLVQAACNNLGIQQSDYRFSRKAIRAFTGWSDSQLKVHCKRLEELEFLLVHNGGRGRLLDYELLFDGKPDDDDNKSSKAHCMGLIEVKKLNMRPANKAHYDANPSGVNQQKSAPGLAQVWPKSGGDQGGQSQSSQGLTPQPVWLDEKAPLDGKNNRASHRTPVKLEASVLDTEP